MTEPTSEMMAARRNSPHQIPSHVAEFFSDDALEVLTHFGFEAPLLLNRYACALEDALIEQVKKNQVQPVLEAPKAKVKKKKMSRRLKKKRKV